MKLQVTRWASAAAVVLACQLVVYAPVLLIMWQTRGQSDLEITFSGSDTSVIATWCAEFAGFMVIYVLAEQISRRLLHGRHQVPVGLVVFLGSAAAYEYLDFAGPGVGLDGWIIGWQEITVQLALPFAAGAWMLRTRLRPERDLVSPELLGSWDAPGGTLDFQSDGLFTLSMVGGSTTAGMWEPLAGPRPRVVLKVDADTQLGHGWQATVLDLESGPYGAVLHGSAAQYRRREAETVLERAAEYAGYVGAVEVLEG